jgi:mannose/cellobiose epimerase-like protein (N-acyl-D-glucosamine 2-epimerase family)
VGWHVFTIQVVLKRLNDAAAIAVALILSLFTTDCPAQSINAYVDRTSVQNTIVSDVDLWNGGLSGTTGMGTYCAPQTFDPTFTGLFYTHLERDWAQENYPNGNLTSISQSRAIYSNIQAYHAATELGQDTSRFASATQAGADYLLSYDMWDGTYGGWFWGVKVGPIVNSTSKNAYGQVHPIFTLAHAYGVTGDQAHLNGALAGFDAFTTHLTDTCYTGAYQGDANRDWTDPGLRNLDYMCHTFETEFALWQALPDGHARKAELRQKLEDTGNHITTHMIQPMQGAGNEDKAFIPWYYNDTWTPLMGEPDPQDWWGGHWRYASPGHQFEYAFLLSRAVEFGAVDEATGQDWLDKSEKLINYALEYAFDEVGDATAYPLNEYMAVKYDRLDFGTGLDQGVPVIHENYAGTPLLPNLTWWPQAEAARALGHWAQVRGKTEWWDEFNAVYSLIGDHLVDDTYGGWYYGLHPDTLEPVNEWNQTDTDKASEWKVNYHAAMMFSELARLAALIAGDLNCDGFVGIEDLNLILCKWNQTVSAGDLMSGDPTCDGFVGIGDLNLVLGNWNTGIVPPTDVPEPGTACLLGMTWVMLIRLKRMSGQYR